MDEETEPVYAPIQEPDDGFASSLQDAALNFDSSLRAKFSDPEYIALRTIGAFIMRGLTLEESCILSRVSIITLKALMEKNEDVRNFIIFKQIAFKAGLLSTISTSAKTQAKMAGYLLEKKYPAEYDPKKGDEAIRPPDLIERAIEYVRRGGDATPIVRSLPQRTGQVPTSFPQSLP